MKWSEHYVYFAAKTLCIPSLISSYETQLTQIYSTNSLTHIMLEKEKIDYKTRLRAVQNCAKTCKNVSLISFGLLTSLVRSIRQAVLALTHSGLHRCACVRARVCSLPVARRAHAYTYSLETWGVQKWQETERDRERERERERDHVKRHEIALLRKKETKMFAS